MTGAGTGIGRGVVKLIARSGGKPVLLGRRRTVLEDALEEIRSFGADGLVLPTDLATAESVRAAVGETISHYGKIDALVNNAGIAQFGRIEHAPLTSLDLMLDVHLRGPIALIQAALPSLTASRGCIVNVTSVGGVLAAPGRSFYGATKAALNHLTRSLAQELAPEIRVNAIVPGPVRTPIYENLGISERERDELVENLVRLTPAKRFAEPDEVARWIGYLLDETNNWMTGALICVDGGRSS